MLIYRFEKNGIGPYVGGLPMRVTSWIAVTGNAKATRKANHIRKTVKPRDWSILWMEAHKDKNMLFGCPSKDMLRAYFGYRFKPLFQDGYRIHIYDVPDDEVLNMGIECAFPVKYSKLKSRENLRKAIANRFA